jgi:hypothetical protein
MTMSHDAMAPGNGNGSDYSLTLIQFHHRYFLLSIILMNFISGKRGDKIVVMVMR